MWDIDYTLLRGGGVASRAWKAAFTELTGQPFLHMPDFGGRTDLDIFAETFRMHGVTDHEPELFFARYVEVVHSMRHEFALQGTLMPGVREVLGRLTDDPTVVQTLVTGNVPFVAAAKVDAFGLSAVFDASVGGYGTDDHVRATLVRRSQERAEAKYGEAFRVVVIGDTVHDVDGARANGARAIGVATGAHLRRRAGGGRRGRGAARPLRCGRGGGRHPRLTGWDPLCGTDRVGEGAAEAAVAAGVELARVPEMTAIEVRPQGVQEDHLRVRRLPDQEVRRALFPRRAQEHVDLGHLGVVEVLGERLLVHLVGAELCPRPRPGRWRRRRRRSRPGRRS